MIIILNLKFKILLILKKKNLKKKQKKIKTHNNNEVSLENHNNSQFNNNKLKDLIKYLYMNLYILKKGLIEKTRTDYYNCYDSRCQGRGNIQFDFNKIPGVDLYNSIFEDSAKFILTKKHNIAYSDHSYKRKALIKIDYANNNITYDKLKNYDVNY